MISKDIQVIFTKINIVVYLNNNIFFTQSYIKGKSKLYTFFLVMFILNRYGFVKSI